MCQGDDASDLHASIPQRPAGLQCGGSRRDDVIDDEYLGRREPPHVVASQAHGAADRLRSTVSVKALEGLVIANPRDRGQG
jgi:hypothetical protein